MADQTDADKLKYRFHQVFRSAPQEFEAALFEFERYCEDVMLAVTKADASTILNIQGRIQQTEAILRIFKECRDYKPRQPAPPAKTP
jgi:hypothetical protein